MAKVKGKRLVMIFWNLAVGGVQTRMIGVMEKVVADGGKVLLLLDKRAKNEIKIPESKSIKVLIFEDLEPKLWKFRHEIKRPFRRIFGLFGVGKGYIFWTQRQHNFILWIIKEIWSFRPDAVLAVANRFSAFAVIIKLLFKLFRRSFRLVINECVVTSKYLDQYEEGFWKKIVKWTYPWADQIIVATEAVKNDLVVNFRIRPKVIKIIRSWTPKIIEQKNVIKKYDGVYVGRLAREKGIDDLVALAKEIKKNNKRYKLAIMGEGVLEYWLKKEIRKNGLEQVIDYLGYKTREQVIDLIKKSKWLLLPSKNEGLPMVILEAYSVGVPVVVKPFSGVEEVVTSKTGLISKMETVDFVRLAMLAFGKKWSKRRQMEIISISNEKYSRPNLDKFVETLWG
jgi:glycosyltransferase involved in cell wall biosynthesis